MRTNTPIHTDGDGRWCISSPAGREIAVGHAFDENRGYRVTLKFSDSAGWNSLSVEAARVVVADMRGQNVRNRDAIVLAADIERWANHCERLNAGWLFMGSPAGGFDALAHGSA
ncbi:hypothetical protein [Bradyrhizobium erythrophlei]|uniref:Uncharacterized protein n=1 Tax=Bradyrhizobium erythrophlei TaxID=1437360 RepID=A0A1M5NDA6_9BRAD|nr:hypothetical protein [Bradyrhizobium erythrophlei]SHG87544.1 hypothetical protein SAMN05443248_2948 [Bradyrhizobium erythrophlei]